jgi:signal transduction histidine kinase
MLGQSVHRFIPERFRQTHLEGFRDFGRTNLEKWWVGILGGVTALRADGEEFPIEAAISQVEIGGRKLYTIILRDITERKQAEEQLRNSREQLRALAAHLESVREDERARIAREIHDELGQVLTGLRMDLSWVVSRLPGDEAALMERSRSMLTLIDTTIRLVRRIATELRPGVLDDLGLVAAIEWQAQEFQTRTGIACEFASNQADLVLAPELGTAAFRICQETLTNVARHAHATRVHIRLEAEAGQLVLTVADNGRGITEQELANRTSLGLLGMRERALLLGGQVSIGGKPGEGTTVTVRIPLSVSEVGIDNGIGRSGQQPLPGATS